MCTGIGSPPCPEERLAWQLYDEHGYRPRALRPCLTAPRPVAPAPRGDGPRRRLLRLLTRR